MNDIVIINKILNDDEIKQIIPEVKKFPRLVAGDHRRWNCFTEAYVAQIEGKIIGSCSVVRLGNWVKLGPLFVFKKYHGKGIGHKIVSTLITDNSNKNLYVGSFTPAVWKIAENFGFQQVNSFWNVPFQIKKYIFTQFLRNINASFIKEYFNKMKNLKGEFRYYTKFATPRNDTK